MINKFVLAVLFLSSIGLFVMLIDPTYKENQLLLADRAKLTEALDKAHELQKVHEQLEEKSKSISASDLDRLNRLLPDHVDNVRLILDIDQIANRYGLTITDLAFEQDKTQQKQQVVETQRGGFARPVVQEQGRIGNQKEDTDLRSLSFEFTISSSYSQFLKFIKDLERSLRLVDIVGISLSSDKADFYDFKVKIATYWLTPQ